MKATEARAHVENPQGTRAASFLTQGELAKVFQVPRQRILAWQKAGAPCICVTPGAKRSFYRYSVQEVAAWLKGQSAGKEVEA